MCLRRVALLFSRGAVSLPLPLAKRGPMSLRRGPPMPMPPSGGRRQSANVRPRRGGVPKRPKNHHNWRFLWRGPIRLLFLKMPPRMKKRRSGVSGRRWGCRFRSFGLRSRPDGRNGAEERNHLLPSNPPRSEVCMDDSLTIMARKALFELGVFPK